MALSQELEALKSSEAEAQEKLREEERRRGEVEASVRDLEQDKELLAEKLCALRADYEGRIQALDEQQLQRMSLQQTHASHEQGTVPFRPL